MLLSLIVSLILLYIWIIFFIINFSCPTCHMTGSWELPKPVVTFFFIFLLFSVEHLDAVDTRFNSVPGVSISGDHQGETKAKGVQTASD